MNILLINKNPVVSKLITLSSKKNGDNVVEINKIEDIQFSEYDVVFVDNDFTKAKDIKKIKEQINYRRLGAIIPRTEKENDLFDFFIKKPFLPTDLVDLLSDLSTTIEKEKKEDALNNLESKEDLESDHEPFGSIDSEENQDTKHEPFGSIDSEEGIDDEHFNNIGLEEEDEDDDDIDIDELFGKIEAKENFKNENEPFDVLEPEESLEKENETFDNADLEEDQKNEDEPFGSLDQEENLEDENEPFGSLGQEEDQENEEEPFGSLGQEDTLSNDLEYSYDSNEKDLPINEIDPQNSILDKEEVKEVQDLLEDEELFSESTNETTNEFDDPIDETNTNIDSIEDLDTYETKNNSEDLDIDDSSLEETKEIEVVEEEEDTFVEQTNIKDDTQKANKNDEFANLNPLDILRALGEEEENKELFLKESSNNIETNETSGSLSVDANSIQEIKDLLDKIASSELKDKLENLEINLNISFKGKY
jgi:hypothetical protein